MADEATQLQAAPGVRHALLAYTSPRALFHRVEDTGAYGWTLVTLLALVTLVGYAEVQTGLIDRVVDRQTEKQLADLERTQLHLVDRVEFRESMEEIRKGGEFTKLMKRLEAVVASPVFVLASALLIASCLYAVVAMTGQKPEYHTLLSICVYAGFIELLACTLRLAMVINYRTIHVDTSLGMLAGSKQFAWLEAIDPFRIWYWIVIAIGLAVTHQLSRRMAIVSCVVLCISAVGIRVARAYAQV